MRPKLLEPVVESEREPDASESAQAGDAVAEAVAGGAGGVAEVAANESEATATTGELAAEAAAPDGATPNGAEVSTDAAAKESAVPSILEQIAAQTPAADDESSADAKDEKAAAAAGVDAKATDEVPTQQNTQNESVVGTDAKQGVSNDAVTATPAAGNVAVSEAAAPAASETTAQQGHFSSLLEQIEAQASEFEVPEVEVSPAAAPAPMPAGAGTSPAASTPASQTATASATPQPRMESAAPRKAPSKSDLPTSFIDEVSPKAALMGLLTRMLPIDADILTILDEDWRVARATGTATGSRNLVTFPLRYLQEDGSAPVSVTIKRSNKATDVRRWQLALVDGDDGTGRAHEAVGLEGLPQEQGGCWAQLSPKAHDASATNPTRALAQFMEIGTWEQALGTLAREASPERWNYPGEGVGAKSRYGVLRDYLSSTLARVRATDALAVSADGSLAAFDTGLLSTLDEKLYAVLTPTGIDIPWHLEGFAEAGSGELGSKLVAAIGELPTQAIYLQSIDDVMPRAGAMVIPDYRNLFSECLDRLPAGWLHEQLEGTGAAAALTALAEANAPAQHDSAKRALGRAIADEPTLFRRLCRTLDDAISLSMRRAQASYRHVAPAYDAARDRMLLLLPLALVDETNADCALVLELMPSGAYQAASIATLPAAYAAARVVSADMPTWLTAEKALG